MPWLDKDGYLKCWDTSSKPYKKKSVHRMVMEDKLGRKLKDDEDVHHIDGNRTNNSPSNLEVVNHSLHILEHHAMEYEDVVCDWCGVVFLREKHRVKHKLKRSSKQFCSRSCGSKNAMKERWSRDGSRNL